MDLDDTGRAGISLADLLAAAEAGDPLDVKTAAAAAATAEKGLAELGTCADAMAVAQDGAERADLFRDLTSNPEITRALAYAFRLYKARLLGELGRIRVRPITRLVDDFSKEIARTASKQDDEVRQRTEQASANEQTRILNQMTKSLGVQGLVAPVGYSTDPNGVYVDEEEGQRRILTSPIVITGSSQDLHTSEVQLTVAWLRKGRWTVRDVPRNTIMDTRGLITLSSMGAPVDSTCLSDAVGYLAAFEAANLEHLQEKTTTQRMGWHGENTFVLGNQSFGDDLKLIPDGGFEHLARGFHTRGTFEGWCQIVEDYMVTRPLAMLSLYAALCTALLEPLGQPGFGVDISGETSMGKTTVLCCAASTWGVPDDRGEGIVLSWASSSMVGPMAVAHFLQSLPVMLDDTKRGNPRTIGAVLYDIPAGQERLRGSVKGGLQTQRRWRTCLLSTGEAPITTFNASGGAMARVLCLQGAPFGEPTEANRKAAEDVRRRLMDHYGHMGPKLVRYFIENPEKRENLRRMFEARRDRHAADRGGVAGRVAAYVAILEVTKSVCEHLGMPEPVDCDPIRVALDAALEGATESDPPTEAIRAIYGWATASQARFWGRHDTDKFGLPMQPPNGFAGEWFAGKHWEDIAIRPEIVKELLTRWGYDAHGVIAAWRRREWLVTESDHERTYFQIRRRLNGERVRLIALKREFLTA